MSNLSFISKLTEKAVANQLNSYISKEVLSNVNQSAYRRLHSTETALLKIQDDTAASMDSGKAFALTLLDLSAAFDIINQNPLFNCLSDCFGVYGTVLMWIKSCLTNRRQKLIASRMPSHFHMGSTSWCSGSTLFHSSHDPPPPLSNIISSFNVIHHLYADDTQIYLAFDSRNFDSSIAELTECLACIQK